MILEEIMAKNVKTLSKDDTIQSAFQLMCDHHIRHLPITDEDNRLTGLVTNQDIRDATPSIFRSDFHQEDLQKPLSTIMKTDVITGHPLDFVEDTAALFYENKIGCLPILKEDKLVGIVTETDVLHTFVKLTGADQPGSFIQVKVLNKTGILSEIAGVFKDKKVNIQSVLVYPDSNDERYRVLVIRVQTMNPMKVVASLKEAGYEVIWPNMPELLP